MLRYSCNLHNWKIYPSEVMDITCLITRTRIAFPTAQCYREASSVPRFRFNPVSNRESAHAGSSTPHGRIHEDLHRSAVHLRLRRMLGRADHHGSAPHPRMG